MHQLGSCQFDMSLEPKSNNKKFPSHQNDNKIIETILSSAPALWSKCPLQQIKERLLQGHHKDCNNDNEGPKNACPQGHVAEPSYLGGVVTTSLDKHTHVKHAGGILCWPSIDRLLREFEWLCLISLVIGWGVKQTGWKIWSQLVGNIISTNSYIYLCLRN